jgi:hypothetical protein
MVGVHNGFESMRVTFQIVLPLLKRRNNGQEFLVKNLVVPFGFDQGA